MSTPTLNSKAIGVFDSGVGGISILKQINTLLPHENLLYVADSQYTPYGNKSPAEITERCFLIADFLIEQGVKALVVACNTATAAAITKMRARYDLPIIGMEPAVKPAVLASKNGVIGVLATVGTLKSAQFAALLDNYGHDVTVLSQGCEGLVECIERGELEEEATRTLINTYLHPLLEGGVDTIVLGCTHYHFVRSLIEHLADKKITIIDTGAAVAMQLKEKLIEKNLLVLDGLVSGLTVWTNSESLNAKQVIEDLLGCAVNVKSLDKFKC
jgi:glutamate racemase